MSNTNKHRVNWVENPFIKQFQELCQHKPCPRRSCKGSCIQVLVRYEDETSITKYGPINYEHECTTCGKVIRDPNFMDERKKYWNFKNYMRYKKI